jgi:hypothetical protein
MLHVDFLKHLQIILLLDITDKDKNENISKIVARRE